MSKEIEEIQDRRRSLELSNTRLRNANSKAYSTIKQVTADCEKTVQIERTVIAGNELAINKNQGEYEELGEKLKKLQKS